ncbi:alkaline phosphatase [Caryophanon tenue]|uniref:Alkaline phosphatase n=1 Tax=Caryophanon tenue TaxID=33978 RepID=A0A1C0YJ24_9BACL|nr:alkaline phosphatase [Caryophanon tenue]OCS87178.1 alkaline phosphatase [Caryophanon tenue]
MRKWSKQFGAFAVASTLAVTAFSTPSQAETPAPQKEEPTNVIMLIMDGSSDNVSTLARWYTGQPNNVDEILTGAVRTYSAESAISDSAPAATALATGHKSNSGYVGVLPSNITMPGVEGSEEDAFKPVANVLEGAQLKGMATGIVSTSEIQHATPAGFSAHATSRSNYDDIAEQQVYRNMDVVLGGGLASLQQTRKDGENLLPVVEKNYDFVQTREALLAADGDKIWGAFAPSALAYDFDREKTNPEQPTLAEMTSKAIDTLNEDKDGFFLMVEGSKIDWAAHANDPIGMVTDFLSFDAAVGEALDFAKEDGNTLVIAVTDHANSGITIGNTNTNSGYDKMDITEYINPLKEATMTLEGALSQLKEDRSNLEEVAALYGLKDLTAAERTALQNSKNLNQTFVQLLSTRANIGFTTGGHTGDDVFLYSYGPNRPTGLIDNTDLAKVMAETMNVDLAQTTDILFNDGVATLQAKGFDVTVDTSDKANPTLVAKKANVVYTLHENKNTVQKDRISKNGRVLSLTKKFNSVHFYNDQHFYISDEVVNFIN